MDTSLTLNIPSLGGNKRVMPSYSVVICVCVGVSPCSCWHSPVAGMLIVPLIVHLFELGILGLMFHSHVVYVSGYSL